MLYDVFTYKGGAETEKIVDETIYVSQWRAFIS